MQENLVIVESPAKAKTIEKFLGKDFMVKSSFGHIRDLAKKGLGINIDNEFEPVYEIPEDKRKVVEELSRLSHSAKTVWLASDEDREGEAIAWHLAKVLNLPIDRTKRIVFHEITQRAILNAIESPRTIDLNLVNAQQARRVLDRLVGFELSPILWKKVRPALSAGRVQSVAVRLIVEREREIINFKSVAQFRVVAQFYLAGDAAKNLFKATLSQGFATKAEAEQFLHSCIGEQFTVSKAEEKPVQRYAAPPFTTSTLQQEASRKLGMSVSQTMSVAQKLYVNYAGSCFRSLLSVKAKIVSFTLKKIIYPLLLPSHNCIIITMFSFQGASSSKSKSHLSFQSKLRNSTVPLFLLSNQNPLTLGF